MSPPEIQLTLFVPGLFRAPLATMPDKLAGELVLPVIERLLVRAEVQAALAVGRDYERAMLALFHGERAQGLRP